MTSEPLSDIELYYCASLTEGGTAVVTGQDFHHIVHVMKHQIGSTIHVTDGLGHLFRCEITTISKNELTLTGEIILSKPGLFGSVWFCLPILKSADRMEFCIEKLIEIGFTNFLYFRAKRSISKNKLFPFQRMEKIAISAMQQSLNLWRPEIVVDYSLEKVKSGPVMNEVVIFEAKGKSDLREFIGSHRSTEGKITYFLFGPEGGLTQEETENFPLAKMVRLTDTRLRAETAPLYVGSVLNSCGKDAF